MTDAEEKFKGLIINKRKILFAEFNKVFQLVGNKFISKPALTISARMEGLSKNKEIEVTYAFCPFCGKPFEDADAQQETTSF